MDSKSIIFVVQVVLAIGVIYFLVKQIRKLLVELKEDKNKEK